MTVIISDKEGKQDVFLPQSAVSLYIRMSVSPFLVNVISQECILGLVIKFGTIVYLDSKMNRFSFWWSKVKGQG